MIGAAVIVTVSSALTVSRDFRDPSRSDMMPSQEKDIDTVIPDLRDIPVDRLAELGSSALAHSIALYRERLRENGVPLSSFQARI
jgi:hypothetical protein